MLGVGDTALNNSEQSLLSQNFESSAEDIKKNYIQKYGITKCGKCHKGEKNRLLRIHKGFDVPILLQPQFPHSFQKRPL